MDKSPAAVRQIAHRARNHVTARRPRSTVSVAEQEEVLDRFLAAVRGGDLQALLDVLAPDVVLVADGGGLATAVRIPLEGSGEVSRFLSRAGRRLAQLAPAFTLVQVNGGPALRMEIADRLDTVFMISVADGRVSRIYSVRNPEKLGRLDVEVPLRR